ncbi:MAG TPA: phosphatidylglycerophosphatase A, partial [Terriglobales bacterium]|nr:phosphatidylglycerophosphatase A [Terriglobales bacterium]
MTETSTSARTERSHIAWLLATFFGTGFLKPGPGTWASAFTAVLWSAAARYAPSPNLWLYTALAAAIVTIVGVPVCTIVAKES